MSSTAGVRRGIISWLGLQAGAAGLSLLAAVAQAAPPLVRVAPALVPLRADASLQPKLVLFKKLVAHTNNAVAGELQRGPACAESEPIRFSPQTVGTFSRSLFGQFRQKSAALGYPVPGGSNPDRSAFAAEEPRRPPDFELGATLKAFEARLCSHSAQETEGGVWMQVRWEVYAPLAQKVVLDLVTEGSYQATPSEKLTAPELYARAFSAAANNLLAQQAYFDLLHGKTPIPTQTAFTPLRIRAVPEPTGSVQANYPQLANATLTLLDGSRSGSGFLISRDGYLLTNHHVLGEQRLMKVRLSDGSEQVAELVRSHRARDVALMKLSAPAASPLHLTLRQPVPGEDAFVIGSPLGKTFAGTLTRGVISGVRQINGNNYIQSDARILPGSSGGPLLDAKSRVVGMAVSGVSAGAVGINLFIPIEEALKALAIEIE